MDFFGTCYRTCLLLGILRTQTPLLAFTRQSSYMPWLFSFLSFPLLKYILCGEPRTEISPGVSKTYFWLSRAGPRSYYGEGNVHSGHLGTNWILGFSFSSCFSKEYFKMGLQSSSILFTRWALTAIAESITFAYIFRFGELTQLCFLLNFP